MNYRHAFGHSFAETVIVKQQNAGRFLFDRCGSRVANAYITFVAVGPGRQMASAGGADPLASPTNFMYSGDPATSMRGHLPLFAIVFFIGASI